MRGPRAIPPRPLAVAMLFIALWVASMAAGAPARVLGPPVLYAIEPRGASELVIQRRPGSTVARFDLSDCPRSPSSRVVTPWGLYRADVGADPRRLAITCEVGGVDRLDLLSARAAIDVTRLGNGGPSLSGPLWSTRSGAVAFVSGDFSCTTPRRPTPVELWIARPSGRARKVARIIVARDVVRASVEDWAPDGSAVIVKTRAFGGECRYAEHEADTLYVVSVGKHPTVRQLARGGDIGHAHWSPDGRLIAVTRGGGDECQLDLLDRSARIVRTIASVDYVPGGCFLDALTSNWVPGTSQIVFSNGMAVYRAEARSGVPKLLYSARRNRLRCSRASSDCPGVWLRDVARSGHVLVSASPYTAVGRTWLIDPSGTAKRLPEKPDETPVRFADA